MNSYFEFLNSVKLLCGAHSLERLPHEMHLLGATRALLLSDAMLEKIGTLATIRQALGDAMDSVS